MKLTPEQYFTSNYFDIDLRDCCRNPRPATAQDLMAGDTDHVKGDEAILAGANIYRNLVRRKKQIDFELELKAQFAGSDGGEPNGNIDGAGGS
ncbi:hypothetical protein ABW21_db0206978 [Orbilia brochopaga]|nr:hypothetical protein ABW21_db0206978 [Drechslerella brochopaga]